jgi:hypothetical protein
MSQAETGSVPVRVARYRVARFRLGRTLAIAAAAAGALARGVGGNPLALLLPAAAAFAALVAFASERRGFGGRPLAIANGKIDLGEGMPAISPVTVHRWMLTGRTARLYGKEMSWSLRASGTQGPQLGAYLARVLGKPLVLRRRGSARTRLAALLVALGGVGLTVASFTVERMPMPIVALSAAATLGGFVALGVLSQRISF